MSSLLSSPRLPQFHTILWQLAMVSTTTSLRSRTVILLSRTPTSSKAVRSTGLAMLIVSQVQYCAFQNTNLLAGSVTTPLLLLDLAILAGLNGANITVAIVADIIMILTGLFAGLVTEESSSWGYYTIACIAYLVVVYQLAFNGRNAVSSKDSKTATFFTSIAGFTLLLWTAYPMYVLVV